MFAQRIWDCFRRAFLRILVFSYYHLGENGVLILLGVVTGLITGVGVGAMKSIAGYFSELALLLNQYGWSNATFALPAVGLFGAFWVGRLLLRKHHSSNLSWVIYDLQKQHPKMSWQETFSHIFTGAITVGLGGSSGLETPSVLTGGAIGDKTGEFCRLTSEDRNMLMVCGTAAGISAVFGSPIAGVLFALEVVFPRQERRRLVPILLASAGAAIIDRAIFGGNRYMFQVSIGAWTIGSLLYFVVLGVVCAFVGVYTIRVNYRLGEFLKRMFPHRILRLGIGCIGLAGLLALFPILAGDGYKFVQMLFSGVENSALSSWNYSWNILFLASAVVLLKIVATVFTLECGGDGGIFAPTIFIGAFTGFLLARTISAITGIPLSDTNFVLAGMCGVFTAALRAPLTGIFLIVEVTGAFGMTVPLMIVAGFSYFTAIFFEPYSIYTKVLGMRHLLEPTPDERSSRRQTIAPKVDTKFSRVKPSASLSEIKNVLTKTKVPYLPVLNDEDKLLGVIISKQLDKEQDSSLKAEQLMIAPPIILNWNDNAIKAKICFEVYRLDYLPVVKSNQFMGFLAKRHLDTTTT